MTTTTTPGTNPSSEEPDELCSKMVTRASRFALLAALHPRCGASSIIGRTLDSTLIRHILGMFDGVYPIPSVIFPKSIPWRNFGLIMSMIMKDGVIREYVTQTLSSNDIELKTAIPLGSSIIEKYPRNIVRLVPFRVVRDPPFINPLGHQRSPSTNDILSTEFTVIPMDLPYGWYRESLDVTTSGYGWRFDAIVDQECSESSSVIISFPFGRPSTAVIIVISKVKYTIDKPSGPENGWRTDITRLATTVPWNASVLIKPSPSEFVTTGLRHLSRMMSALCLPTICPGSVFYQQIRATLLMILGV